MDYLEKALFLNITSYQMVTLPQNHPEYFSTWKMLSEEERGIYVNLTNKLHEIWTYINMPEIVPIKRVNSVFEYDEKIAEVDDRILKLCRDFGLSLKEQPPEDFKAMARKVMGDDYLDWLEN